MRTRPGDSSRGCHPCVGHALPAGGPGQTTSHVCRSKHRVVRAGPADSSYAGTRHLQYWRAKYLIAADEDVWAHGGGGCLCKRANPDRGATGEVKFPELSGERGERAGGPWVTAGKCTLGRHSFGLAVSGPFAGLCVAERPPTIRC